MPNPAQRTMSNTLSRVDDWRTSMRVTFGRLQEQAPNLCQQLKRQTTRFTPASEQTLNVFQHYAKEAAETLATTWPVPHVFRNVTGEFARLSLFSKLAFEQTETTTIKPAANVVEIPAEAPEESRKQISADSTSAVTAENDPPEDMGIGVSLQDEWMRMEEDGSVSKVEQEQDVAEKPELVQIAPLTSADIWRSLQADLCQTHPPMEVVANLQRFIRLRKQETREAANEGHENGEEPDEQVRPTAGASAAEEKHVQADAAALRKQGLMSHDIAHPKAPTLDQEDLNILDEMQIAIDNLNREAHSDIVNTLWSLNAGSEAES